MKFIVPHTEYEFSIPDEWWIESGMNNFSQKEDHYISGSNNKVKIISIEEIKPPLRTNNAFWFRNKESIVPVLKSIANREALDPITVWSKEKTKTDRYIVKDGFHKFYASVAAGFSKIPININDFDLKEFIKNERNQNNV